MIIFTQLVKKVPVLNATLNFSTMFIGVDLSNVIDCL
jgi:hypothetical protein